MPRKWYDKAAAAVTMKEIEVPKVLLDLPDDTPITKGFLIKVIKDFVSGEKKRYAHQTLTTLAITSSLSALKDRVDSIGSRVNKIDASGDYEELMELITETDEFLDEVADYINCMPAWTKQTNDMTPMPRLERRAPGCGGYSSPANYERSDDDDYEKSVDSFYGKCSDFSNGIIDCSCCLWRSPLGYDYNNTAGICVKKESLYYNKTVVGKTERKCAYFSPTSKLLKSSNYIQHKDWKKNPRKQTDGLRYSEKPEFFAEDITGNEKEIFVCHRA